MCNIEYENNNARSMWFSQATFAYVFYCRSILEILQSTIMLTRWMMIYEWFSVQRAKLPKISSAHHINGSCVLTFNVSFMIRFILDYKDCTIHDVTLRVDDHCKLNSNNSLFYNDRWNLSTTKFLIRYASLKKKITTREKDFWLIHISCSLEINES